MKQVFQADDGSIHKTKKGATKREDLLKKVAEVRKTLPNPKDPGCNFANGHGYYQLQKEEISQFKRGFRRLIKAHHPTLLSIYDKCPQGIIGRYLCDSDSPLYSLYCTLICIDDNDRLWGQAYFAHTGDGEQINLRR